MSIIVTGASGNFGRKAADLLLDKVPASELILITRRPAALAAYAERGAQVRYGDFDEPASLAAAFAGGQRMLLISTDQVGGERLRQHRAAIDAAVAAGVQQIAYTSFIGVGPDNPAISTVEHTATEAMLRACGVPYTFLRDSQYADAIAQFALPGALAMGAWMSSAGDGRIALVAREDCVACAVAVVSTPGHENKIYDITGPELLSYRDCVALAVELSGRPLAYDAVTDEQKLAFFDSIGVPRRIEDGMENSPIPWPGEEMVSFERAIREGHFAVLSDHVERLTGRKPKSLRQVCMENIDKLRLAA
ncbi:SDR family oxidoreductase [Pseudoduganella namucuonensis]|uniref:NAD(P)H dehydrogenase (Quinone) n=1 Tax=Pseudoduganella namucuonensis TaxID=1035707 RepID=A0A1I7LE92_9BURK|nr:SDR family oxidoreductase [Pseudoduganella namucuonensis]SFV07904.1 NAD(P)H dehydrogenase (quinone) [Pseudoduganella namucuonensis]